MEREFSVTELRAIAEGKARYTTLNAFARHMTGGDRQAAVVFAAELLAEYDQCSAEWKDEGWWEVSPGVWTDGWHTTNELDDYEDEDEEALD